MTFPQHIVLYPYNHAWCHNCTYRYIVCTFPDQRWRTESLSSIRSPVPPSALKYFLCVKKVQVATSFDFVGLYGYCLAGDTKCYRLS